ncbi:MAG: hypothetical protein QGG69_03505 [Kiritimatiellia bacterium]|nr:hypothetical protein [Kiritimatiellia bacterium]
MITFTEHPVFTKRISELLSDEEYREFQTDLAANPQTGDVIPGLGGLRKIRLALPGRGKRGGARVLYLLFLNAETVFLLYVFTKGVVGDLPPDETRVIQALPVQPRTESAGDRADGQESSAQVLQHTVLSNWPMIATLVLVLILIASSLSRCVRGENSGETGVSTEVRPLPFAEDPPEPLMD